MLRPNRQATTPARALTQVQLPDSLQPIIPPTPEAFSPLNALQPTTQVHVPVSRLPLGNLLTPARVPTRAQCSNAQLITLPTSEAFSLPNSPYPTTPASVLVSSLPPGDHFRLITTLARAPTQAQPPDAKPNILLTLETFSLPNAPQSTTPASIPISSLPLGVSPTLKTIHPIYVPQPTIPAGVSTSVLSQFQL